MSRPRIRLVVRFRPPRSPAANFVLWSAAVHVVLVAVAVLFPTLRAGDRPIEDVIVVMPVADLPGPVAPPVEAAPEPEAPEPEVVEPEPEEARLETRVPDPAPPKPEKKEPPKKVTAPPAPPVKQQAPPPDPGEAGGAGRESTIESIDFEGVEFAWYRDRVAAALKSHWRQPVLEGLRDPLTVTIAFEILADGSVRKPKIVTPSGIPSLDRSALRAVLEADPLPPLPPRMGGSSKTARFDFTSYP